MGVGDETAEKIVTIGFHCAGQVSAKAIFAALSMFWKLGGKATSSIGGAIYNRVTFGKGIKNQETFKKQIKSEKSIMGTEVSESETKDFDSYARKYHFRYALTRETNDPTHYFFSFDKGDAEKVDAAFRDWTKDRTHAPTDILERLAQARERAFSINKSQEQSHDKHKSHHRERGVER